jgi:hypothetical protein
VIDNKLGFVWLLDGLNFWLFSALVNWIEKFVGAKKISAFQLLAK